MYIYRHVLPPASPEYRLLPTPTPTYLPFVPMNASSDVSAKILFHFVISAIIAC